MSWLETVLGNTNIVLACHRFGNSLSHHAIHHGVANVRRGEGTD